MAWRGAGRRQERPAVALDRVAAPGRWADTVAHNEFLLRATVDGYEFTVFPDNRAIIKGTADEAWPRHSLPSTSAHEAGGAPRHGHRPHSDQPRRPARVSPRRPGRTQCAFWNRLLPPSATSRR
ncbi:MAG: hypothetical protein R2854_15770 [Caldilineaceae bacterium]